MYKCAYNKGAGMLQYEWDAHKAQVNLNKHKMAFTFREERTEKPPKARSGNI
jgi:hypothetical protein